MKQRTMEWKIFFQDVRYNLRNTSFQKKAAAFGKLLILLFIMLGIPILLLIFARDTLLSKAFFADLPSRLQAHPKTSFLILVLLQMAQIVICVLPGQPIQFASSYLYGIGGGYVISLLGSILGCIITYKIADFLGSDAVHLVFGEGRVKDYINKLNSGKAILIVFLIYLIPAIPKDLVSYIAGISDMRLLPFLGASTLGRTPGLFLSLSLGYFWAAKNYVGISVIVILMISILLICYKFRGQLMKFIDSFEERGKGHHEKSAK